MTSPVESIASPARSCNGCALCCKLGEIPAVKAYNEWCMDCTTRMGCDRYETRPTPCRSFYCHYLLSDLSEDWRPSSCGMVISTHSNPARMTVQVDLEHSVDWRKSPYIEQLQHWASEGFVIVMRGEQAYAIYPHTIEDLGIISSGYTIEITETDTAHGIKRTARRIAIA